MPPTMVRYTADGWGVGELWFEGDVVVWHELPRFGSDADGTTHPLAARICAYLAGEPDAFDDVRLDLTWCTPFQRALLEALRSVRRSETITYGELAALAGRPNAQRAAGNFCAGNRFPLLVPCHRVVAADGLGSYGTAGADYKRRLLALEDVFL